MSRQGAGIITLRWKNQQIMETARVAQSTHHDA